MRDHRQGNDLKVAWSILRAGKPFILSGMSLKLYLRNAYELKEVEDFAVKGNQIHWTFYGKDQQHTGKYSLILVRNEGEVGMITIDICDFVNIVSCSCKVKNSEDLPNVEIETIELTSNLDYVAGAGGGGSYDDTAIWDALNDKVDKEKGKGLSTNDYTDEEKQKLAGLENYDDRGIKKDIEDLSKKVEDLEQGGQGGSTPDLSEYLTREEFYDASEGFAPADALEGKQDTIEDLDSIRSGAGKGATAVQPSTLAGYATTQQLTELSEEVGELSERIDNLPTAESLLFEVVYGETPYNDIIAASKERKHVICYYKDFVYNLTKCQEGYDLKFSCADNEVLTIICKVNGGWSASNAGYERISNKVTSLSDKSTDTQYPSAKAVYDFVNNTLGTIINGDY